MVLTCTVTLMLGHVRVGACTCITYMYVCMHVHVCASPCILSYGRIRVTGTPPRRRCPDKGGLSVSCAVSAYFKLVVAGTLPCILLTSPVMATTIRIMIACSVSSPWSISWRRPRLSPRGRRTRSPSTSGMLTRQRLEAINKNLPCSVPWTRLLCSVTVINSGEL